MALTRDFLKGFNIDGLSDDFIQKIMDEHGATITANNKAAEDAKNALNNTITDLTSKLNTATSSITTMSEKYKAFEGVDLVALNKQIEEATANHVKLQSEFDGYKMLAEGDALLRESLASMQFSSSYAKKGVYSDIKDKVKFEDGKLTGFEEAIKAIQEANPTAFAVEKSNDDKSKRDSGRQHNNGGKKTYTQEQVKQMSPDEINKNWEDVKQTLSNKGG